MSDTLKANTLLGADIQCRPSQKKSSKKEENTLNKKKSRELFIIQIFPFFYPVFPKESHAKNDRKTRKEEEMLLIIGKKKKSGKKLARSKILENGC